MRISLSFSIWLIFLLLIAACTEGKSEERTMDHEKKNEITHFEKATYAGGCFWGIEETFRKVPGVVSTQVGYTGGNTQNPTYKEVCSDRTGHAEAVEVTFDPNKVQGPDVGSQYRSAIFYHDQRQKELAEQSIKALEQSGRYSRPIVVQIVPASVFWRAEEYHQRYLQKSGIQYCH